MKHRDSGPREAYPIIGVGAESLVIILVNYNGWAHTIECLESLLRSECRAFLIVVVDNASTDDSNSLIRAWALGLVDAWVPRENPHRSKVCPPVAKPLLLRVVNDQFQELEGSVSGGKVVLVQSSHNGGFGAGNNLGMAYALTINSVPNFFWLLNNDTVVGPEAVGAILDSLTGERRVWGTWLMEYASPEVIQVIGGCRLTLFAKRAIPCKSTERIIEFHCLQGASMIFPTKFFLETGGFDEKIFMYCEDMDFGLMAKEQGYALDVLKVLVYHKGGSSSCSVLQWVWTYRHKHYVIHKHFGWGVWDLANAINLLIVGLSPFSLPEKRHAVRIILREKLFKTTLSKKDSRE